MGFKATAYDSTIRNWVGKFHVETPVDAIQKKFLRTASLKKFTGSQIQALLKRVAKAHMDNRKLYRQVMYGSR
jgi:hypothetical protein